MGVSCNRFIVIARMCVIVWTRLLELIVWPRKKKQKDANIVELVEGDEDKCDVLSVINRSIGNKDR